MTRHRRSAASMDKPLRPSARPKSPTRPEGEIATAAVFYAGAMQDIWRLWRDDMLRFITRFCIIRMKRITMMLPYFISREWA